MEIICSVIMVISSSFGIHYSLVGTLDGCFLLVLGFSGGKVQS